MKRNDKAALIYLTVILIPLVVFLWGLLDTLETRMGWQVPGIPGLRHHDRETTGTLFDERASTSSVMSQGDRPGAASPDDEVSSPALGKHADSSSVNP